MSELPPEQRAAFATLAETSFGLTFPASRLGALDDAVREACQRAGIEDPAELLQRAEAGEERVRVILADTLTVGETYFFRDPQHFELLRRVLVESRDPVLLWSAGCASGAEPYTMAIVARQVYGASAAERVRVLGTDLSGEALAQARRGTYRPWAMRGLDEGLRRRWFQPDGRLMRIVPEVRELVRFGELNLLDVDDPHWPRDVAVAFCRNVLVYFSDQAIARAAKGLHRSLREDGILITGPADPLLTSYGFSIDLTGGFIAYRRVPRPRPPLSPPRERPPTWLLSPEKGPGPPVPPPSRRPRPSTAPNRPPAPPQEEAEDSEAALARVRALADRGDSTAALKAAYALTAAHPLLADAWLLRALMSQVNGDHREAVRSARRALLLDRSLIQAHMVTAPSALALGDRARARRSLRNARLALQALPPDASIRGSGATAAEVLSACLQMERAMTGVNHA